MTSIFLAREFGVRVYAGGPLDEPRSTIGGAASRPRSHDLVCPIKAEAHALPFAQGFFDAVVSVDAYQYFGTDELYIDYLSRFVRPNGSLGVVVVGLMQEMGSQPPAHLTEPQSNGKVFWESSCRSFKTAEFWRSSLVRQPRWRPTSPSATQPDGWRHWRDFERALSAAGKSIFPSDAEALDKDQGRYLGFVRLTARRTDADRGRPLRSRPWEPRVRAWTSEGPRPEQRKEEHRMKKLTTVLVLADLDRPPAVRPAALHDVLFQEQRGVDLRPELRFRDRGRPDHRQQARRGQDGLAAAGDRGPAG
ncbi:MAG: hypothetical protein MZV63_66450 [Marinilabiliales bacterium]|nr:hypothetical protein [Marinilabiliales bacterium]